MKKTKLLTSLAALALVLSLGACEKNVDVGDDGTSSETSLEEESTSESTSEEESTSENTSEDNTSEDSSEDNTSEDSSEDNTSSVEPPVTSIAELTFEVTLYVNGVADSCPDYGALYYLGGFNGYIDEFGWSCNGEYVKLNATTNSKGEVAYSYTFTDVPVADDHEWNIVFYYDDEEVGASGSFSTHALVKYQNIEVKSDTVSGSIVEVSADLSTSIAEQFPDPNAVDPDLEIAQAILDNILGKTPEWEAFYGYAEDDYDAPITEYLTVDSDGNLYGYKDCDDFDDDTYTYYYYGGYKCMYSYSGHQAQTPAVVYTTYEEELGFFTTGLEETFDLSDESHFELNKTSNGYELTVLLAPYYVSQESYTFTVDASYNLLAIDRETSIGSPSDAIVTSHAEGITYADVEAAMAETDFDPVDFGLGEEDPNLEIAQAILDAVNEGISWDAFHGEYIDEGYDERETVYLTEDEDGMYGSIIDTEDDEVTFAYYYQDGKEYEYAANRNAYEVDDQWAEYSDHLDEYIEEQLDGAEDFDLDSDTYELKEYGDGYELIFTMDFMGYYEYEYIYIVDEDFNVTALAYGEYFAGDLEGWYAEETTFDMVAASMEDFDPSDWGVEEDQDLEIVLSILQWAAETDEYDIPELWDAVHIDDIEYDWDEEDEYWITIQDDALYGRFEQSGIEDTSYSETRYFMNNYYFSIQNDDDEISYDYDTYYEDYEDIIDAYTYPIADAENFLDEDDDGDLILSEDVYSYELTENSDGGYTLKLTYSDWWGRDSATIYTYTTDENLDVYKIEYEEGSIEEEDYEYNLLEWISEEVVEQKMSDFDISLWID